MLVLREMVFLVSLFEYIHRKASQTCEFVNLFEVLHFVLLLHEYNTSIIDDNVLICIMYMFID